MATDRKGGKDRDFQVVGTPRPRIDGVAKVTGQTRFADDLILPRMLWCKLLRSPHPHARIVRIDTSRAAALPGRPRRGYRRRFSHSVRSASGQPGRARPLSRCRPLHRRSGRAVAARDEDIAAEACRLIDVTYEPLTTIGSVDDAATTPAPQLHDYADSGNLTSRSISSSATWKAASQRPT
jgi:CO/xanthine dehydrogenase Mo-binding subunit